MVIGKNLQSEGIIFVDLDAKRLDTIQSLANLRNHVVASPTEIKFEELVSNAVKKYMDFSSFCYVLKQDDSETIAKLSTISQQIAELRSHIPSNKSGLEVISKITNLEKDVSTLSISAPRFIVIRDDPDKPPSPP
ncbi:MAG: hypothetical protein WAM14_16965 [Candidatus Nitrosopolaris sp.]